MLIEESKPVVSVLMLSSSAPVRRMLHHYLNKDQERQYEIAEETHAPPAARLYAQKYFDLVLLGEHCEGGGPIAFLDHILKSPDYWHPVIFVHSGKDHERSVEALHRGAQVSLSVGQLTSFELLLNIQKVLSTLALYRRNREITAELYRSNQELAQFAYAVAHDLREPLRKVQSFGALLKESLGEHLDAKSAHYLERMVDGARRASEMMLALLEYAKLSRQGKMFDIVDLGDVLKEVLDDLELVVREKKAVVRIQSALPRIQGEKVRLHQLLYNLLSNSLKYSRAEVIPEISIRGQEDENEFWMLEIRDNGIGFPQDQVERIFALFQRLHARSSHYEGYGVGLAMCRRIVESMGGQIQAFGFPGEGATFRVLLPKNRICS